MIKVKPGITAAIIAKNAAISISRTLESIDWVNAILILDDNSSDNTVEIARSHQAQIIQSQSTDFAAKRNTLLKHCTTEWIYYIDTDEIVTKDLKSEIITIVKSCKPANFQVSRVNYYLGTKMGIDWVDRLFHITQIKGWQGEVHESPILTSPPKKLKHSLIHNTHTDITSMLNKTNQWSEIEAKLRFEAHHPPIKIWRMFRITVTYVWQQFINKYMLRYGRSGLFEGYFQIIDKLIVYTKLWELQQRHKS